MTHREHVSKEEAQAFAERIAKLEAERNEALTRAEAAEAELREMQGMTSFGSVQVRPVRLFHVKDDDRPLYVVAADWEEALLAWRDLICDESEGELSNMEQPLGIDFVADHDELLVLSAQDLDQVVR